MPLVLCFINIAANQITEKQNVINVHMTKMTAIDISGVARGSALGA